MLKIGVPFDVAHSMDWVEATAYLIAAGELEGGKFDWDRFEWEKPR